MKYATPAAFRTALEQRLVTTATQTGAPVARLRKLVAFDRLLARLLIAAPDRWILKGALALEFRLGGKSRFTKDMDLAHQADEQATTADFVAAQAVDLGDHFTFAIERTGKLDVVLEGAAVRYHIVAGLAGRVFDQAIVDVGFGNPLASPPDPLRGPDLLTFADIAPIVVPALPLEQHVAEKVHAYTRTYASRRSSTRVKDLVDLVLIRSYTTLQAGRLRRALQVTFDSRGSHTLPATLPPPPTEWTASYRAMATAVGLDPDLSAGHLLAAAFLDPVLGGAVPDGAHWDVAQENW
jgi:hypothetical protein